jgi:gliding motility-associated-like protein
LANIVPLPLPVIPNTFTPNGDGVNDTWNIANLPFYPNCLLSVYNRYGAMLFQSKGYGKAWDGTYKGASLPVATYYYIIDLGDGSAKLNGSILIIR